jgi:dTMP kinase
MAVSVSAFPPGRNQILPQFMRPYGRHAGAPEPPGRSAPTDSNPSGDESNPPADNTIVFHGPVPRLLRVLTKTFAELGYPGRLIAVEGLDGSGKSTQVYLLKRWLQLQGLKVFFTEWNSSEVVKSATSKGKKMELLTPTTFSLIHATDFADRYERQLVPLLKAGYLVLCDRYVFTAFARDVVRGCPLEWVRGLYDFACLPDLTFFFKADLEVSLNRILQGRPQLKYFEAGMDLGLSSDIQESFRIFQGRMLEQYLGMSTEFSFTVIDANRSIEPQQDIVRKLVARTIEVDDFRFVLK